MANSYPLYSTIDLITGFSDAGLTIMYRGKRFHIQVSSEQLALPGSGSNDLTPLQRKLRYFLDNLDEEPQVMEELEEWMVEPCLSIIRDASPSNHEAKAISLQEYFAPTTIQLQLIHSHGNLGVVEQPPSASLLRYLTPAISTSEVVVTSALREGIRCIPASSLVLVRKHDAGEEETNSLPREVQDGQGTRYHFKPALEKGSFSRELTTLLQIRAEGSYPKLRTSRIAGLAQIDGEESILGLLLHFIPNTGTLAQQVENGASAPLRQQWAVQIEETVAKLHTFGVVWGDVKPDNVLVDAQGDAVLIDFGGGFAPEWVDKALENTTEGDIQGVSKMRGFLENALNKEIS